MRCSAVYKSGAKQGSNCNNLVKWMKTENGVVHYLCGVHSRKGNRVKYNSQLSISPNNHINPTYEHLPLLSIKRSTTLNSPPFSTSNQSSPPFSTSNQYSPHFSTYNQSSPLVTSIIIINVQPNIISYNTSGTNYINEIPKGYICETKNTVQSVIKGLAKKRIGSGAHSIVYSINLNGKILAYKEFKNETKYYFAIQRELEAIKRLSSPYLMKPIYFDETGLIMTLGETMYKTFDNIFGLGNISLYSKDQTSSNITSSNIRLPDVTKHDTPQDRLDDISIHNFKYFISVCLDVVKGLEYLHYMNFVHMDIKPGNIIIIDGKAKIIDFGACVSTLMEHHNHRSYTTKYASPEVLLRKKMSHTQAHDMWSMGILMYRAFFGTHPFQTILIKKDSNISTLDVFKNHYSFIESQHILSKIETNVIKIQTINHLQYSPLVTANPSGFQEDKRSAISDRKITDKHLRYSPFVTANPSGFQEDKNIKNLSLVTAFALQPQEDINSLNPNVNLVPFDSCFIFKHLSNDEKYLLQNNRKDNGEYISSTIKILIRSMLSLLPHNRIKATKFIKCLEHKIS